ncbi:hypothetical protein EDD18DRAFT_1112400 [Armillaria luteobubalina]|uniref:Uncharacterized protein n=1 Tax=Armillaria luteobubalina TaxID=153913 RepID=A0AA39PEZ9_9AGAR|nr:hypothetical protein EDD18DRAFT_1112400 [Armillaria luteobubalina]
MKEDLDVVLLLSIHITCLAPEALSPIFKLKTSPASFVCPGSSEPKSGKTRTVVYGRIFFSGYNKPGACTTQQTPFKNVVSPSYPPTPKANPPSIHLGPMHQRFTVVPFLVVHLILAALEYDDSVIQYAVLALRELISWTLPSNAILILDHEIGDAHGDLIEAAEAGRLGRDASRALWDTFYPLEDSFRALHEETRRTSRYPWTDAWAMLRWRCVPIYKSLWKVRDFRRQIMSRNTIYTAWGISSEEELRSQDSLYTITTILHL